MNKRTIALLGASLMLALAFVACRLPGAGGGTPTAEFSTPAVPIPTGEPVDPSVPTNTDGAETILIPAGTFWMGSEDTDALADEDEMPRHQVTLGPFPIYTHEVTNEMYARCIEAGWCDPIQVLESGPTSHHDDPAFAAHPVVGVDWNMADDYCAWAGARLPTEAEWEYAARSAQSLVYPWGSETPTCDRVNMLGCLVPPDTVKVGSYRRGNSPFGVWDLSGNVWEWTHDWYDPDYYALSPSSSPVGPNLPEDPDNPQKVVRGGGLQSEPAAMRSAGRVGARLMRPFDDVGFRCVALAALDLPADYAEAPDAHELMPPDPLDGGGELVEDPDLSPPDWWMEELFATVSCPDASGRVHVTLGIDAAPGTTLLAGLEGSPDGWIDCPYDEDSHLAQCSMAAPEGYTGLDTIQVHYLADRPDSASFRTGHFTADVPEDCSDAPPGPDRFGVDVDCPEAGSITITFSYEPAIDWDTVRIGGTTEVACVPLSDTELLCTAPDLRSGDHYEFYLHGTDASGAEREWTPWVPLAEGCPVGFRDESLSALCHEGHQAVQVMYSPVSRSLESVSAGGAALACIGMAPGVQVCGDLPGSPGSDAVITTCFTDEECTDWTVPVTGCGPGWFDIPDYYDTFILSYCATGGTFVGPAIWTRYHPGESPVASATSDGVELTCFPMGIDWFCGVLPGAPGSDTTATVCLENGFCFSEEIVVPDYCEGTEEEFSHTVLSGCYPGVGAAVAIQYFPTDQPLVSANANGFDLTCEPATLPGYYLCHTLPGAPGSTVTITFCLADGTCHSRDITVDDCGIEAVPFDEGLAIGSFGCHSETAVYFVLQTTLEWLAGGTPFTYTASDGDTDYICSLHPTIPHALYCSGEQPDAAGTLEVCIQQAGAPGPICQSFPGWPSIVTVIGDCAPPIPGVPPCSTYTSAGTCPLDRCYWEPKTSTCHPR